MADNFSEQLLLLRADFTAMNAMVQHMGGECQDRHDQLLDRIESVNYTVEHIGQQLLQLGQQTITATALAHEALAETRRASAESRERWNQLSGRIKLSESRMNAMLEAVDSDRLEWRGLYGELDERVNEVEKRLPPPES